MFPVLKKPRRIAQQSSRCLPYHSFDLTRSNPPRPRQGARGFLLPHLAEEFNAMPLLLRTLLAAVPAGASPPLAIAAVALVYVLTQREIDAKLSIR